MWIVELVSDDGSIWKGEYTDERCARSAYERACSWAKSSDNTDVLICIRPS
jgi:hypothetical protein